MVDTIIACCETNDLTEEEYQELCYLRETFLDIQCSLLDIIDMPASATLATLIDTMAFAYSSGNYEFTEDEVDRIVGILRQRMFDFSDIDPVSDDQDGSENQETEKNANVPESDVLVRIGVCRIDADVFGEMLSFIEVPESSKEFLDIIEKVCLDCDRRNCDDCLCDKICKHKGP